MHVQGSSWKKFSVLYSPLPVFFFGGVKSAKEIRKLVEIDPGRRDDKQKTTLANHFIRFGYSPARKIFTPLNERHKKLTDRQAKLKTLTPSTMVWQSVSVAR